MRVTRETGNAFYGYNLNRIELQFAGHSSLGEARGDSIYLRLSAPPKHDIVTTESASGRALVAPDDLERSPTTSIYRVLVTMAVALLLSIVLDARGILHSGNGMPDGRARTVTLRVGQFALQVAEATHLSWAWDRAEATLGRNAGSAVPPLLAAGTQDSPGLPASMEEIGQLARWFSAARIDQASGPRQPSHVSAPSPIRPTRMPTRRNPLRLLVTGDSLSGFLGPELVDEAARVGPVAGFVDTHNGTGITRPDYVDWSVVARQQVAAHNPDAVVVFMGGNDFQNMVLLGGRVLLAGTPAWTQEYQRRAAICMRIWSQGGTHRVYWLSIPPARDSAWAYDDRQINLALQRAASQVPGARYLDILGPVTDHGRYADFVTPPHGQPTLVRQADGVHLSIVGSIMVAHEVLPVLVREWHLNQKPQAQPRSRRARGRYHKP